MRLYIATGDDLPYYPYINTNHPEYVVSEARDRGYFIAEGTEEAAVFYIPWHSVIALWHQNDSQNDGV